ncbi:MAG: alpha-galactosidase [Bacillota bacterium]|nr:MAG: alpha-galactosidase [Bacillota bacterium]
MAITVRNNKFILKTDNTAWILRCDEGYFEHLYYGADVPDCDLDHLVNKQILNFAPYDARLGLKYIYGGRLYPYSGANAGDFRTPACDIVSQNGHRGCRFRYAGYEILPETPKDYVLPRVRAAGETLKVVLTDEQKGVDAELYFQTVEECDAVVRYTRIVNRSGGKILLDKAASLQLDFENGAFDLLYIAGAAGDEMRNLRRPVAQGKTEISSSFGITGHSSNPFFALCERSATEDAGECYGFNLLYSGNFKNEIESDSHNSVRVVTGINADGFCWSLGDGESFYTPQAVCTFSEEGIGGMSRRFHRLCKKHIIAPKYENARPVAANTWESFYFTVNEDNVCAFAEKAKEIGADTVVLDDGWFRNADAENLGDWQPVPERFPSGLGKLVNAVKQRGLQFGLWFEPEMVSKNSKLFQAHPEWVLNNGDIGSESRNQYVLDMANPAVVDYLYGVLAHYLSSYDIRYIKWDMNRYLSEVGSAFVHNQGETPHRYVLGVYDLLERITSHFDVLVEGCAGGGGRFDLGMLYYEPMIWLSDNTDPYNRTEIQFGASVAYPPCTLSYHFSKGVGTTGKNSEPFFRALAANFACFGYELDLTKLSAEELSACRAFTERRRALDKYILGGDFYRLNVDNEYYYACLQVLEDKSAALFTFLQLNAQIRYESVIVRLKGLKPDARYKIGANGQVYYGRTLEKAGLKISDLLCPHWKTEDALRIAVQGGKSGSGISFEIEEVK